MSEFQPIATFPEGIKAAFSQVKDGSMAAGGGLEPTQTHLDNAERFLREHGFSTENRARIHVTYQNGRIYDAVTRVPQESGQAFETDALYTTEKGLTLTLPVADCLATIVYDPETPMLGMLHLGRHSSVDGLIEAFAKEVGKETSSRPENWHVWMSPGLQRTHNKMDYFTPPSPEEWRSFQEIKEDKVYIDMAGHNRDRFIKLGVAPVRIVVSQVDTYIDQNYFSHRAATEPNGDLSRQGRMMTAAMLT